MVDIGRTSEEGCESYSNPTISINTTVHNQLIHNIPKTPITLSNPSTQFIMSPTTILLRAETKTVERRSARKPPQSHPHPPSNRAINKKMNSNPHNRQNPPRRRLQHPSRAQPGPVLSRRGIRSHRRYPRPDWNMGKSSEGVYYIGVEGIV